MCACSPINGQKGARASDVYLHLAIQPGELLQWGCDAGLQALLHVLQQLLAHLVQSGGGCICQLGSSSVQRPCCALRAAPCSQIVKGEHTGYTRRTPAPARAEILTSHLCHKEIMEMRMGIIVLIASDLIYKETFPFVHLVLRYAVRYS